MFQREKRKNQKKIHTRNQNSPNNQFPCPPQPAAVTTLRPVCDLLCYALYSRCVVCLCCGFSYPTAHSPSLSPNPPPQGFTAFDAEGGAPRRSGASGRLPYSETNAALYAYSRHRAYIADYMKYYDPPKASYHQFSTTWTNTCTVDGAVCSGVVGNLGVPSLMGELLPSCPPSMSSTHAVIIISLLHSRFYAFGLVALLDVVDKLSSAAGYQN